MKLRIKVRPHSMKEEIFKISENSYVVYLKGVPRNGEANMELLKFLRRYFKKNIRIISGFSSREKIIEIDD
jgi:uncharacterized protein (TIGR00251 family)